MFKAGAEKKNSFSRFSNSFNFSVGIVFRFLCGTTAAAEVQTPQTHNT